MTFRCLPMLPPNRSVRAKYLREIREAYASRPIPPALLRKILNYERMLLDDQCTTGQSSFPSNPGYSVSPYSPAALKMHARSFLEPDNIFRAVNSSYPGCIRLLASFPPPMTPWAPTSWNDPASWTFNYHGSARRIALAAIVDNQGLHNTIPFAYAPSAGRLMRFAGMLSRLPCGLALYASPAMTCANSVFYPVIGLTLYNT
jgi:hypothetical protein